MLNLTDLKCRVFYAGRTHGIIFASKGSVENQPRFIAFDLNLLNYNRIFQNYVHGNQPAMAPLSHQCLGSGALLTVK